MYFFFLKTLRFRPTKRGVRFCSVFDVKCAVFGLNAFDPYLRHSRFYGRRSPPHDCRTAKVASDGHGPSSVPKRDILRPTTDVGVRKSELRLRSSRLDHCDCPELTQQCFLFGPLLSTEPGGPYSDLKPAVFRVPKRCTRPRSRAFRPAVGPE